MRGRSTVRRLSEETVSLLDSTLRKYVDMVVTDHRTHNRDCFYKYTSATTALKILKSSAVRYSSPLEFNDPFDVQSGLHIGFDTDELPDKIMDRFEQLILQDASSPSLSDPGFAEDVFKMQQLKAATGAFPKEALIEHFRPRLIGLTQEMITLQRQLQDKWWKDFLPRLRVFSVSEEKDNLLMWAHYAKDHTGVVFEFRVLAEQNNALCVAKPIRYCELRLRYFLKRKRSKLAFLCSGEVDENLMEGYALISKATFGLTRRNGGYRLECKRQAISSTLNIPFIQTK